MKKIFLLAGIFPFLFSLCSASELDLGYSSRELSLAGTPLGIIGSLSSIGNNPAGITDIKGHQILYSLELLKTAQYNFIRYGFNVSNIGAIGFNYFAASNYGFGVTYAGKISSVFSAGGTMHFFNSSDNWLLGIDAGLIYYTGTGSSKSANFISASVCNLNKGMQHYPDFAVNSMIGKLGVSQI